MTSSTHLPADLTDRGPVNDRWWKDLRSCVKEVRSTAVPPGREVMTQAYIGRIPRFIPALEGADLTVAH